MKTMCPSCEGKGEWIDEEIEGVSVQCSECHGTGKIDRPISMWDTKYKMDMPDWLK